MPADKSPDSDSNSGAGAPGGPAAKDPAALRAWYAANYKPAEPAGSAPAAKENKTATEPTQAASDADPDAIQEIPTLSSELLSELRQRKQAEASARTPARRAGSGPNQAALAPEDAAAQREQRRREAELIRTRSQKKSRRWQLMLFMAMLTATLAGALVIYWLIQTKFGGKIPYIDP